MAAMESLGYRPNAYARALVNQTSDCIGVLVADVSDPFFGAMVNAISQVARDNHKQLLVCSGFHQEQMEREALELLCEQRSDALIIHSKALSDAELIEYARRAPGMVLINRMIPELEGRCFALDNSKGGMIATRHLLELGHRQIAHVSSNHQIDDTLSRCAGYRQALEQADLPFNPELVEYTQPDEEGGEQAMLNLLAKGLPLTGVFVYNDAMAAGVISVLTDNGYRVPEDVSVIGFDDVIFARYLRPKLTTMRYPIAIMAAQCAHQALALAENKQVATNHSRLYVPTLIKRYSVAMPPRI